MCVLGGGGGGGISAFSCPPYQVHGQLNAVLKGDGGMIGLTETRCPKDACMF